MVTFGATCLSHSQGATRNRIAPVAGRDRRPLFRQQLLGGLVDPLRVPSTSAPGAPTWGIHHSFFCHGLRLFFSTACEFPRGTWASPNSTTLFLMAWRGLAARQGNRSRIFLQGPLQSSLQVPPLGTAHRTRRRVHRHHPPTRISQNTGPGTFRAGLFPPRIRSKRHTVLVPWLPPSYVNTPKKG